MMNKVESFDKFNKKRRRSDKRGHMRMCGFTLSKLFETYIESGKPSNAAMEYLDALTNEAGGFRHAVTLPFKDTLGYMYYEIWIKEIKD